MRLLYVLHPFTDEFHANRDRWRWAVSLGTEAEARRAPGKNCVNAGIRTQREDADRDGQLALYSVMTFCDRMHIPYQVTPVVFDYDVCEAR